MNSPLIQLLVLAGIAVFLILRLKNVLGTREGFEKPPTPQEPVTKTRRDFEVIEGGPDRDITDYVAEDSAEPCRHETDRTGVFGWRFCSGLARGL